MTATPEPHCPQHGQHSDAAKRVSDQYNLHRVAAGYDAIGKVFAVALADGRSDGVLYDSMLDAVIHQRHDERFYGFVRIHPSSMSPCYAQGFLNFIRSARDRGMGEPDRDHHGGGRVLIPRMTIEDQRAQVAAILGRGRPTNLILPHR